MKVGLTFDVKVPDGLSSDPSSRRSLVDDDLAGRSRPRGLSACSTEPDDLHEEFDSPQTIQAIGDAIASHGHQVSFIGDGRDAVLALLGDPPDLVFNIAEGEGVSRSREARIPALLEILGIPYTGSDPLTLTLTLDKVRTKILVAAADVPTPRHAVIETGAEREQDEILEKLRFPLFVKPAYEGSSKGIRENCLITDPADLAARAMGMLDGYRQPLLVEEFIDGRELTVGLIGNDPPRVIGIMEIQPRIRTGPFIYGVEVKRNWENLIDLVTPAPLHPTQRALVEAMALKAWDAVGGRDVGRMDFRLKDGIPYFLEVNPLPGLSPISGDLVILARGMGIDYRTLVGMILECASSRVFPAQLESAVAGGS